VSASPLDVQKENESDVQDQYDDCNRLYGSNEEDADETHRTNIELSKLATQCARNHRDHSNKTPHPAMLAYQILRNMTYRDTVAYNTVLKALAKSTPAMLTDLPNTAATTFSDTGRGSGSSSSSDTPNLNTVHWKNMPRIAAAERAQTLLLEMVEDHEQQRAQNQDWYERNACGNLSEEELVAGPPRVRVKPNVRSFSTVMDAWSRTGNVVEALQVLQLLKERYEANNDVALQPNIVSYNSILSAYSKCRGGQQAAEDCQAFLESMPVEPDVVSYNCCLHAWARSGAPDAGERAEAILRSMPVAPNARSYTIVMDAWSRSSSSSVGSVSTPNNTLMNDEDSEISVTSRAHALLNELKDLYERTGNPQVKPNCISYSTVINAYAYSKEPLKARKSSELLQEMIIRGDADPQVLPNTVTYNSVLNACATSSPLSYSDLSFNDDVDTDNDMIVSCYLQEMIQTLYSQLLQGNHQCVAADEGTEKEIVHYLQKPRQSNQLAPDHFTFGTVLKACANNIFWDDSQFGIRVFGEACRQGQVSLGVLVQLRNAVSSHTLQELLPEGAYNSKTKQFSMTDFPDSWTRNVRDQR